MFYSESLTLNAEHVLNAGVTVLRYSYITKDTDLKSAVELDTLLQPSNYSVS